MSTKLLTGIASALVVITLGSCGGDGGGSGGACGPLTACGGDVVGTWTVKDFCGTGKISFSTCPQVDVNLDGVKATGEQTFGADKTYSSNTQVSGSATMHIPTSCLMFGGLQVTCDFVNMTFMTQNATMPNDTIESLTCSKEATGCSCKVGLKAKTLAEMGTYSSNGTSLTLTPSGGTAKTNDYCVAGTTLTYRPAAGAMATGSDPGALATVVLTKK